MEKQIEECRDNHFWTTEEENCLLFFVKKMNNNLVQLQSQYFPHRTVASLKSRLKKLNDQGAPLGSPLVRRISLERCMSNVGTNVVNRAIKLLTPTKIQPIKKNPIDEMDTIQEEEAQAVPEDAGQQVEQKSQGSWGWGSLALDVFLPLFFWFVVLSILYLVPEETLASLEFEWLMDYKRTVHHIVADTQQWAAETSETIMQSFN